MTSEWHVPEELLARFLHTEASREESQRVVRHLMTGCPSCLALSFELTSKLGLFTALPEGAKAGWEQAYEQVFARALAFASEEERRLALEKLRGWARWAELEPLNPQLRFATIESDSRFHTFGVYQRLLEASRWHRSTEPAEAVDIVRLALMVAERLDPALMGEKRVSDLKVSAWAELGNAKRIAEDFEGARRAFNEAWRILGTGEGDSIEEGHLISLEASYMKDVGEFEMAESSLGGALEIYRRAGDLHQQGRVLLKMGEIIGHLHPGKGIARIRQALAIMETAKEPRLEICAEHALAWFLNDNGQSEEALAVLERARPLYRQFRDDLTQLRLHWLEARIAYRLGEYGEAESIFSQIWEEFRVRNLNQEVVLVTIDLAQVLTAKDETERAAQLAAECYSIMKNWGLHKDALAAWIVFQEALSQEMARGELFGRVGEYFRRHWFIPAQFEGSSPPR
jgi:tetratricopeptide (TPR) repeat protein